MGYVPYDMNTLFDTDTDASENSAFSIGLSPEVIMDCKSINNLIEAQAIVKPHFCTHYANAELDSYGIFGIVCEVLRECEAVFKRGIENTDMRDIALTFAPTTAQIIALARPKFNAAAPKMRYKPQAVKNVLSTYGAKKIRRIKLEPSEMVGRARSKWYLIKED